MSVLHCWSDLPDPREERKGRTLALVMSVAAWQHCLKHWTNRREPWKDEFGADTVGELRKSSGDRPSPEEPPARRVLEVLENQTRESLRHPLVLVFQARQADRVAVKWILVLPCGAQAIAVGSGSHLRWVTCYYPYRAAVEKNRSRRWEHCVRHLIRRYVRLKGEPPRFSLPQPDEQIAVRDTTGRVIERVRRMRYITPENWGFCPDLEGCPWRGRLVSWEAAKAATQGEKPGKKRRLNPRRCESEVPS